MSLSAMPREAVSCVSNSSTKATVDPLGHDLLLRGGRAMAHFLYFVEIRFRCRRLRFEKGLLRHD
jgi:hypothetical protein